MFLIVPQPALEALRKYLNENTCAKQLSERTICAIYNANAPFAQHLHIAQCKMHHVHHLCTVRWLLLHV